MILATSLNGGAIPVERGGPVRLVVPTAHGYKNVKWLTHIQLTNDYRISDTYARPAPPCAAPVPLTRS